MEIVPGKNWEALARWIGGPDWLWPKPTKAEARSGIAEFLSAMEAQSLKPVKEMVKIIRRN